MTTPLLVDEALRAIDAAAGTPSAAPRPDGLFGCGGPAPVSPPVTVGAVGAPRFARPEGSAGLVARGAARPGRAAGRGPATVRSSVTLRLPRSSR